MKHRSATDDSICRCHSFFAAVLIIGSGLAFCFKAFVFYAAVQKPCVSFGWPNPVSIDLLYIFFFDFFLNLMLV